MGLLEKLRLTLKNKVLPVFSNPPGLIKNEMKYTVYFVFSLGNNLRLQQEAILGFVKRIGQIPDEVLNRQ